MRLLSGFSNCMARAGAGGPRPVPFSELRAQLMQIEARHDHDHHRQYHQQQRRPVTTTPVVSIASSSSAGAAGGSVINVSSSGVRAGGRDTGAAGVADRQPDQAVTTRDLGARHAAERASTFQSSLTALETPSAFNSLTRQQLRSNRIHRHGRCRCRRRQPTPSRCRIWRQAQQLLSGAFAGGSTATVGTGTLALSLGGTSFSVTSTAATTRWRASPRPSTPPAATRASARP